MNDPVPTVRLEIRDHVAYLTLARAQAANQMNLAIRPRVSGRGIGHRSGTRSARGVADRRGQELLFWRRS